MSTNTGWAPAMTIVDAEATNENAGVITSSPGPTPTAVERQAQRVGARAQADAVPDPGQRRQLGLQRLALRPQDEPARGQHALDRVHQLAPQRLVLPGEIEKRDHREPVPSSVPRPTDDADRPAHAEQVQREADLVVTCRGGERTRRPGPSSRSLSSADTRLSTNAPAPHVVVVGVVHGHEARDVDAQPGHQEVEVAGIVVAGADPDRHRLVAHGHVVGRVLQPAGRGCCRRGRSGYAPGPRAAG